MCGLSAKIVDSDESKPVTCKHSTIKRGQIHKPIRSNLLSLTVGFNRIDGSHNKDNRLNLQRIRVCSHSTESWKYVTIVKVRAIG